MAYYGRRIGYRNSYGRRSPRGLFKILTVVIFIVAIVVAVLQTMRVQEISASEKKLKTEMQNLQTKLEKVQSYVPLSILDGTSETAIAYQKLYPEMAVQRPETLDKVDSRAIYLTFEGGPSKYTEDILDYLKSANQKATFFVNGQDISGNESILKRIVNEGHTIGVCGYSDDYESVYESVESFLADFDKAYNAIHEATGVYPSVFRFPKGSINKYNSGIYRELIAEMTRRGFVYFDWNVNGDDEDGSDWETIAQDVANGVKKQDHPIVLLHDSSDNKQTARAVKYMLNYLGKNGYYFENIKPTTPAVTFDY